MSTGSNLEAFLAAMCNKWHEQPAKYTLGSNLLMKAITPFMDPDITGALSLPKAMQLCQSKSCFLIS